MCNKNNKKRLKKEKIQRKTQEIKEREKILEEFRQELHGKSHSFNYKTSQRQFLQEVNSTIKTVMKNLRLVESDQSSKILEKFKTDELEKFNVQAKQLQEVEQEMEKKRKLYGNKERAMMLQQAQQEQEMRVKMKNMSRPAARGQEKQILAMKRQYFEKQTKEVLVLLTNNYRDNQLDEKWERPGMENLRDFTVEDNKVFVSKVFGPQSVINEIGAAAHGVSTIINEARYLYYIRLDPHKTSKGVIYLNFYDKLTCELVEDMNDKEQIKSKKKHEKARKFDDLKKLVTEHCTEGQMVLVNNVKLKILYEFTPEDMLTWDNYFKERVLLCMILFIKNFKHKMLLQNFNDFSRGSGGI